MSQSIPTSTRRARSISPLRTTVNSYSPANQGRHFRSHSLDGHRPRNTPPTTQNSNASLSLPANASSSARKPPHDPLRPFTFKYPVSLPGVMKSLATRKYKRWTGILPQKVDYPKRRRLDPDEDDEVDEEQEDEAQISNVRDERVKGKLRMEYFSADDDNVQRNTRQGFQRMSTVETFGDWTSVFKSNAQPPSSPSRKIPRLLGNSGGKVYDRTLGVQDEDNEDEYDEDSGWVNIGLPSALDQDFEDDDEDLEDYALEGEVDITEAIRYYQEVLSQAPQ
ncbi:hypothetical protein BDR26DRAFT_863176 [Obelidium mucronatum]|nr:hypothetical protein BDR26DRAFT_863176 [Obelidium mucronatum]